MPRRVIKRYLPTLQHLKDRGRIGVFGKLLDDPFLFHLNRRSVAGAAAIGVFTAFLPIPMQMVVAAALAIVVRVNLILAVVVVWISNPFTMGPMLYAGYQTGALFTGQRIEQEPFEWRLEWFWDNFAQVWQPLILGSVLLGLLAGGASYLVVHLLWRAYVYRQLAHRARRALRDKRMPPRH